MLDYIKKQIPFELKRGASVVSIILALIVVGFFGQVGSWIFEKSLTIIPIVKKAWQWSSAIKFEFTLAEAFFYVLGLLLFLFPIYRRVDRFLIQKTKREIIFSDDFDNNKGWSLNYWGTTNPEKTNRIEQSAMVFEATPEEVQHIGKEFGACIDLRNGIYSDYTYDVCCMVKSDLGTTMGFQLWVHDTVGRNSEVSKKQPEQFFTPSTSYQEVRLKYTANSTNAIRIHLHNKAGAGRVYIDKVIVTKL